MENVKKFHEALLSDKALQEKANQLKEEFKSKGGTEEANEADFVQAIADFAKAQGYDFTPEELKAFQSEIQAIPDDQMDGATGGLGGLSGVTSLLAKGF